MKKSFTRFLLLLAMIMPFAAMNSVKAQSTSCGLTIQMTDQFGDGWNGASIDVYQNGTLLGNATVPSGSSYTATFTANSTDSVALVWTSGDYDSECSFIVLSGNDDTLYVGTSLSSHSTGDTIAKVKNTCPTCVKPNNFAIDSTNATSVFLSWHSDATSFEVACVSHGTALGSTPTTISVSDTVYEYQNLSGDSLYDFYVRTNCGTEQSRWVGPLTMAPGLYFFGTSGSDTLLLSSCSARLVDDGGPAGDYSTGSYTLVIRPAHDTATVHLTGSIALGYYYSTFAIYDGEGTNGYQWLNHTSGTANVDITSMSGSLTLYFSCSYSYYVSSGWDLHANCARRNTCLAPMNSTVSGEGAASATISWLYPGTDLSDQTFGITVFDTASSSVAGTFSAQGVNSYQVYGLQPSTDYMATIHTVCTEGNSGEDTVYFRTTCVSGGNIETGHGSTTESYCPIYTNYNYSVSQVIYDANEVGGNAGDTLYGIAFYNTGSSNQTRQITVWIGETTMSSYSSISDVIAVADSQIVFRSDSAHVFTTTPGWSEITFNTPYVYQGGNLVLSFRDSTGSYSSSIPWRATTTSSSKVLYRYRDGGQYEISDLGSGYNSPYNRRPDARFTWPCVNTGCSAPNAQFFYIGSDTVEISWVPGLSESSWNVAHKASADTVWTDDGSESSLSHTFAGLTPNTSYDFRITTPCSEGDASVVLTATTECAAVTVFPLTEGFENFIAGDDMDDPIQSCWHRGTTSSYGNYPYVVTGTTQAHNGTASMNFYGYSAYYGDIKSWLVLPEMGVSLDTLDIDFYVAEGSSYYDNHSVVVLGTMSDPDDISTFTAVDTATTTGTAYEYVHFYHSFAGNNTADRYIAIKTAGESTNLYLDDITVNMRRPCSTPDSVSIDTASTTTLTVSWLGTADEYEVIYGLNPMDTVYSDTTTSANSIVLGGLIPGTYYDVQVRALCGSDTSNWSLSATAHTECSTIPSLPYTEDFDNLSTNVYAPLCWTVIDSTETYYSWYTSHYGTSVTELYDYNTYSSLGNVLAFGNDYDHTMIDLGVILNELPAGINANQVQVKGKIESDNYNQVPQYLAVGVCSNTNDFSTFVGIDTISVLDYDTWHDFEIPLDSYTGTGRNIALKMCDTVNETNIFIDDFTVEMIPTCRRSSDLAQTAATTTTATLSWSAPSTQTSWQIEYGPRGFQQGQGTMAIANANPFTLTGLTANSNYEFNVRAICSATDTAEWAFERGYITTKQTPVTMPYYYNFEDSTEWNNWGTISSTSNNWYRGTAVAANGTHSMYISAANGATFGYNSAMQAVAYRDVDFGTGDSNILLQFSAISGGYNSSYYSNYDNLFVLVEDADEAIVPSTNYNFNPWGDEIASQGQLFSLRTDTNWTTYQIAMPQLSGVHRVVFFYYVRSFSQWMTTMGPAAIDNISMRYMTCQRPSNLRTASATSSSVSLAWDGSAAQYLVHFDSRDTVVSDTTVTINGLVGGTYHDWTVTGICTGADTSMASEVASAFVPCFDGNVVDFPYVEGFENGINCWQQEYVSANTSGQYVDWAQDSTDGYSSYSSQITAYQGSYLAKMQASSHGAATRLVSPVMSLDALQPASLVFAHAQRIWPYDIDTLLVLYRIHPDSAWVTLATYNDSINSWHVDSLALPQVSENFQIAFEGHTEYGYGIVLDSVVVNGTAGGCVAPQLTVSNITYDGATINWNGSAESYDVVIANHGVNEWLDSANVTTNSYTFTDFYPTTMYDVYVRQNCGEGETSPWGFATFTTDSLACAEATGLAATATTVNSVSLSWNGSANNYIVHLFNTTTDIYDTVSGTTTTISGLYDNTTYSVSVMSQCATHVFSEFGDTISVTTALCAAISNVAVNNITTTSAEISWNAGGSETSWEVSYGEMDFAQGTGTTVTVTSRSYTISGLEANNYYDVYVRSICADGIQSDWSPVAQFQTLSDQNGIDGVEGSYSLNIYPNPTSGNTTISLTGVEGQVTITVVDMNGRTISSEVMNCGADCVKTMNVEGLAQGTYFVRVLGDGINSVRKLIVR